MNKNVDFENVIIRLLSRNEYYGHILLQLKTEFNIRVTTAGVCIKNSNIHLMINPEWFQLLTPDQQIFVLQHELAHIILGHLGEEKKPNPKDMQIANIAMDTAIHEILTQAKTLFNDDDVNCKLITVEALRQMVNNTGILNNETTEYYFNFLKKEKEELLEKIKTMDIHGWQNGEDPDIGKALTLGVLEAAAQQCSAGTIPGEALVTIDRLKKQTVNWRAALRRYTISQVDINTKTTRNRRNRRYGFLTPGKKKSFCPKVVNIVDTSGSMGVNQLNAVWAELQKMEKQGYDITVIEADTMVQKSYKFDSKKNVTFTGQGGTLYQSALSFAEKFKPDVVIYLTDLDPADIPEKPKFPVIWAAVSRGGYKPSFGHIIDIKE